jgi:hypothetical protein
MKSKCRPGNQRIGKSIRNKLILAGIILKHPEPY